MLPVVLIGVGIVALVLIRPQMLNHVREMKFMNTSTIREVQEMFAMIQSDGLGDSFRNYVEIKGVVHCDQPVRTPFSDQDVAYCASKLSSVTQREERYRDKDGHYRTRVVKDERVISSEESSSVLLLKDSSSDETVVLDIKNGCTFDIPETFDRFEHTNNLGRYGYFRSFTNHGPNLLGYHMKEKTIPQNQALYVLGEAYKEGDVIHIGRATEKDRKFIVSTKSEDELVGKYERRAQFALFGGIAAIVVGAGMLLSLLLR